MPPPPLIPPLRTEGAPPPHPVPLHPPPPACHTDAPLATHSPNRGLGTPPKKNNRPVQVTLPHGSGGDANKAALCASLCGRFAVLRDGSGLRRLTLGDPDARLDAVVRVLCCALGWVCAPVWCLLQCACACVWLSSRIAPCVRLACDCFGAQTAVHASNYPLRRDQRGFVVAVSSGVLAVTDTVDTLLALVDLDSLTPHAE